MFPYLINVFLSKFCKMLSKAMPSTKLSVEVKQELIISYNIQHFFICHPSDSTVPTAAGIEPRTVATGALAVRRSNH